jgi:hypothetical protein
MMMCAVSNIAVAVASACVEKNPHVQLRRATRAASMLLGGAFHHPCRCKLTNHASVRLHSVVEYLKRKKSVVAPWRADPSVNAPFVSAMDVLESDPEPTP